MPPPLRREILDSEDEDDISPVKSRPPVAITSSGEDALLDMDADQAASTASTAEQLRRAHLDLMAPTQDLNPSIDVAGPVDTISPSTLRKKRRLTGNESEPKSSGKLKRIKTVVDQPSSHPSEMTVPGPTFPDSASPITGTSGTVAGDLSPSVSIQAAEKQTPKTRTRKSSQQNTSSGSGEQNTLTPWSVSAVGSSDRLNSDDAAVGLPKEMYKPRPSRSRSAQVDVSPLDYSIIPEKAAKKAKRAKTDTKDSSSAESVFPSNPILQAPNYERLSPPPPDTERDQPDSLNPTLPATIPESAPQELQLTAKLQMNVKEPAKTKQPGKRGRPRKNPVVEELDELAPAEDIQVAAAQTPKTSSKAEVQVLISPSKSKPASTTTATASAGNDPVLLNNILAGLGHTKSTETTPQPEKLSEKSESKPKTAQSEADEPDDDYQAEEKKLKPDSEPEALDETSKPSPAIGTSKSAQDLNTPAKTPQQTKKSAAKSSPTKPSWQKTPYRVGLSKSQRIPSLLKIMKK